MAKKKVIVNLIHDTKRCYVYAYGVEKADGKITISKRLEINDELDYIEALENGEIEIINSSDCEELVPLESMQVDQNALTILADLFAAYEKEKKMPSE